MSMPEQIASGTTGSATPIYKSVTVGVPAVRAWQIFTERPADWWPGDPGRRDTIVFEPRVGGNYYERATDGSLRVWGRILAWEPPRRLLLTWRINGRWKAMPDDANASEIEVIFRPRGASSTEVTLGHLHLDRHGEDAATIRAALAGPSPGVTLANFAAVVAAAASAAAS
jgi:uncharacterized protein YndB with AHSA1/START domain